MNTTRCKVLPFPLINNGKLRGFKTVSTIFGHKIIYHES